MVLTDALAHPLRRLLLLILGLVFVVGFCLVGVARRTSSATLRLGAGTACGRDIRAVDSFAIYRLKIGPTRIAARVRAAAATAQENSDSK